MAPKSMILVTGGTGLVGRAVQEVVKEDSEASKEQWIFVGTKDADLCLLSSVRSLFERVRPTHVLHLAAKVGGLYANSSDNVGFFRENIIIQDNINILCKEFGVQKLVSCLSTCIFPNNVTYPIHEACLHDGAPHPSNEGYAFAKRMVDVQNRLYRAQYGCNFTSVIPTNVYGMHDNFSLQGGHVVPCLIHKCYLAKRDKTPFVVLGSGKPLRQFIYSADLAKLMVWATRHYNEAEPIILSPAEEVSIASAAQDIADAFQFTGEVVFDTSQADGQYKKTVSNAKLKKQLPDFAFTPMHEGLAETVTWFSRHYNSARR